MFWGNLSGFRENPIHRALDGSLSQLAVDNSRIAYIGDTNTDMKTALGSGLFAIGVTWGFRSEQELRAEGAMQICNEVSQLTDFLLGL